MKRAVLHYTVMLFLSIRIHDDAELNSSEFHYWASWWKLVYQWRPWWKYLWWPWFDDDICFRWLCGAADCSLATNFPTKLLPMQTRVQCNAVPTLYNTFPPNFCQCKPECNVMQCQPCTLYLVHVFYNLFGTTSSPNVCQCKPECNIMQC